MPVNADHNESITSVAPWLDMMLGLATQARPLEHVANAYTLQTRDFAQYKNPFS